MKNIAIFFITFIVSLAVLVTWYVIVQNQKDANFKLKNLKFSSSKKETKSDQMQYQKKKLKKQESKSAAMSKHGM